MEKQELKTPSWFTRMFNKGKAEEMIDLLVMEQEKAIRAEEERILKEIQTMADFHPQWDLSVLKNFYAEHECLVEEESAFIIKLRELLPVWIEKYPKLRPLLMTL